MATGSPDLAWTVGSLVRHVERQLADAGVPEPVTEGRDLVAVVAGEARFWPRLHAETAAPEALVRATAAATARRVNGAPFAYAVGEAAFRGLTLAVDERVLIPRQETELLVDLVLETVVADGGSVADVGTGSGAIALALATEGRFDRVIATDIAVDALAVAAANASRIPAVAGARLEFRSGDLLAPLRGERIEAIVSNPPYIAFDEAHELPASVRNWEPMLALLSGSQGLDHTTRLIAGASVLLSSGGLLALEVDIRRAMLVAERLSTQGDYRDVAVHQDLTGRDRFVLARRA